MGSCAVRGVSNLCYMLFILPCWLCFLCPGMLLLGSVLCSLGEESGVWILLLYINIFWRTYLKGNHFALVAECGGIYNDFSVLWGVHAADLDCQPWQLWVCTDKLCLYCSVLCSQRAKLLTTEFKQTIWTLWCFQYKIKSFQVEEILPVKIKLQCWTASRAVLCTV